MQKQSFLASLFSSAAWKAIGYIVGFIKHIIIAAAIGLSTQLDVFYLAMGLVGILISTWAGALEFASMPKLVRAESLDDTRRFRQLGGGIFMIATYASTLVAALVVIFGEVLATVVVGFDSSRQATLAAAFIWLIPLMLLKVPYSVFGAVLRSKRHFGVYFQSETLISVIILVSIAVATDHPAVLLWSVSLGLVAAFIYTGAFAARQIRFKLNPFNSEIARILRHVPKLMILYGALSVFAIMDRIFGSFLAEGSISALAYAFVMIQVAPGLLRIPSAFMTVAAEKAGRRERSKILNDLFSLVILGSVGATAPMLLAGADAVAALFERGAFTGKDTAAVASALGAFSLMIAPLFALKPLDQIYQIENRVGKMVLRTLVGIVVGVLLNYIAVFVLGWGVFGIALATSVSYWIILLLGIIGLESMGYEVAMARHLKWAGWCALFVLAGSGAFLLLPDLGSVGNCFAAAGTTGLALFAASYLYPESRETELLDQALARLVVIRR